MKSGPRTRESQASPDDMMYCGVQPFFSVPCCFDLCCSQNVVVYYLCILIPNGMVEISF